jgi:hypothetical protein
MASEETTWTAAATHALICNIPVQFKARRPLLEKDLMQALESTTRIKVKVTAVRAGLVRPFETEDTGNTFGIIVRLDEEVEIGHHLCPVHFELRGPSREHFPKERFRCDHNITTRYMVHMLTEAEAQLLPCARVQCIARGCSRE